MSPASIAAAPAGAQSSAVPVRCRRAVHAVVAGCLVAASGSSAGAPSSSPYTGAAPRAVCGPGAQPEPALQGQVPKADRESGRSRAGYRCNIELLGRYQGQGTSWVSASYGRCAYLPQAFPGSLGSDAPGVRVVDVADTRAPRLAGTLTSPAMLGNPWESLKVSERRGLLGGVMGGALEGTAFFDLYDVSGDCTKPRRRASIAASDLGVPANVLGHEGGFSPDGRTFWATGGAPGFVTAIDIADADAPAVLTTFVAGNINHGLSFSRDGRTMFLSTVDPNGLVVLDVSQVQDRRVVPQVTQVGRLTWSDGPTRSTRSRSTAAGATTSSPSTR